MSIFKKIFLFVFLVFGLSTVDVRAESCPALYQRYHVRHTYCLPPNPSCNIISTTVTPEHIQEILKLHNEYRSRIATGQETIGNLPPATDMLQMEWSDELAAVAQKHADQCEFKHDCNECRQTKNFKAGQNLYESWTTGSDYTVDWKAAIKLWYDEVSNFDASIIKPFDSSRATGVIGHFTQVIWSTSWKVGCGFAAHTKGHRTYQLHTCNYGPGGNMPQGAVYNAGQSCSKCPGNTCCGSNCANRPNYPGLCQVQNGKKPNYPRPPGDYSYFCDFEQGTNCHIETPQGMKRWTITRTLSESYVGIVLQGGESSAINFTTTFKAQPQMCLSLGYRKGPTVAGQPANNVAKEHFLIVDMNYPMEVALSRNEPSFTTFGMNLNFNMALKFSVSFSVPSGSGPQYLELKDISVRSGAC